MSYLTANLPGTGGLIKAAPEDFLVEEIPAYPPSGEGQHIFLTLEKRGISTQDMVLRVARALGIPASDIGTAGQKDKMAVARQVISVPAQGVDLAAIANLKLEGVEVLSAARHQNKLRTGHLRGNRFTIVIRGVCADAEARARAILDVLVVAWLPNRFGAQRFGRRGDNADQGRELLEGRRRIDDRFHKRLFLSAYQSKLFNRYLELRMQDGLLHHVVEGEVLQRTGTGGLFVCTPQDMLYAQSRLEMRQIVPTGPIFGHSMFPPAEGSPAARREQQILDEESFDPTHFARFGRLAEGTRRALLVRVDGTSVRQADDTLTVSFALPAGSYATVLLEEIMKPGAPLTLPGDG